MLSWPEYWQRASTNPIRPKQLIGFRLSMQVRFWRRPRQRARRRYRSRCNGQSHFDWRDRYCWQNHRKGWLPAAIDQVLGMKRHGETNAPRPRHRRRTAVPKIGKLPDPHPCGRGSAADEFRCTFGVEGLDTFLEVLGLPQAAVAMAFELNRNGQRRILGIVEELFRSALG